MRRLPYAFAFLVVLTGCANPATRPVPAVYAEPAELVLPVPDGYCQVTGSHPADLELLATWEESNRPRNRVLAVFADCGELDDYRADGTPTTHHGGYMAPASADGRRVLMTRPQFVAQMADVIRSQGLPVATIEAEARQTIQRVAPEIELQDIVQLGLLRADDDAAYLGVLQKWHYAPGDTEVLAIVTGLTLVRGQVVNLTLAVPYENEGSLDRALAMQQGNIQRLVAANPEA